MSKLILNVSKEEFENRLASAIEGAMQSPLKKKRTQILNAAMVQILHGGRADGQNEHNLEQFWKEESQSETASYMWVGTENYRHENTYEEDSSTVTGSSEEEVKRQLYSNVLSYLADTVSLAINASMLIEAIDETGSDYAERFLDEAGKSVDELTDEDVAELLEYSSNAELEVQEAIFEHVVSLSCVDGNHTITEVECKTAPKARPEPIQEPEKRFVTIHTIIKTEKAEGQDEGIDNISVYNTLSAEDHDRQLLEFFRQYAEENASFEKDDLIAHSVTQDVMSDVGIDDEDLESKDFDQIVEWLCENGRPNMLVDMIPDLTYGMYEITVEYKQEQI
ncbi:hypothetical protein ABWJ26_000657 [Vibrio fluvialis]